MKVGSTMLDTICFDNTVAMSEGWAVFRTLGTDDTGDYRIERVDEMARFFNDEAAWRHVAQRATEGSTYHTDALRFIRLNNADEWERIATDAALALQVDLLSFT